MVLDAGEPVGLKQIGLTTDAPGFSAEIQAGESPAGPFETVSENKPVSAETTWELDGPEAQYYVVWVTELIGSAHINEITAF